MDQDKQLPQSDDGDPQKNVTTVENLGDYEWICKYCKISPNTARRWVMDGRIPYIKLAGGKLVRFDRDAIQEWLEKYSVGCK